MYIWHNRAHYTGQVLFLFGFEEQGGQPFPEEDSPNNAAGVHEMHIEISSAILSSSSDLAYANEFSFHMDITTDFQFPLAL